MQRTPYEYKADPAVPRFADDRPAIIFDGKCVLCSWFAQFILRTHQARRFRLLAAQSALGSALYRHFGLDPIEYETYILLENGVAYFRSEASIRIFAGLGRLCASRCLGELFRVRHAMRFTTPLHEIGCIGSALARRATYPIRLRQIDSFRDGRPENPDHWRLRRFRWPHRRIAGRRAEADFVRCRPFRCARHQLRKIEKYRGGATYTDRV